MSQVPVAILFMCSCPPSLLCCAAGYTIFVVEGDLPPCEADQLLSLIPIQTKKSPPSKLAPSSSKAFSSPGGDCSKSSLGPSKPTGGGRGHEDDEEDSYALDLAKALSVSMAGEVKGQPGLPEDEQYDINIASALSESMQGELTIIRGGPLPSCIEKEIIIAHSAHTGKRG